MRIWAGTRHLGFSFKAPHWGFWRFFWTYAAVILVAGWPWGVFHGWLAWIIGLAWIAVIAIIATLVLTARWTGAHPKDEDTENVAGH
jgi:hypothetical protein